MLSVLSRFSLGVEGDAAAPAALLNSNAVPGVLGVFEAEPKEAKAPDPSPNAEDAPEVGDDTLLVLRGDIALNGFDRPWDGVSPPPKRFA